MGLREVGGGDWLMASDLEAGEIALDKAVFKGFGENDNGTFCIFRCPEQGQMNVGGRTLITACEAIDIGDTVRIVYEGQKKFKNGRKGAMWKLFVYDEEEGNGSADDVSDEDESEEEVEAAPKTTRKKRATKKATKKAAKKATRKKKAEPVEEESDDLDELDDLE